MPNSSAATCHGSPVICAVTRGRPGVAQDVEGADLSGVSGTPTFFLNGRRHHVAYDIEGLSDAVRLARASVMLKP